MYQKSRTRSELINDIEAIKRWLLTIKSDAYRFCLSNNIEAALNELSQSLIDLKRDSKR